MSTYNQQLTVRESQASKIIILPNCPQRTWQIIHALIGQFITGQTNPGSLFNALVCNEKPVCPLLALRLFTGMQEDGTATILPGADQFIENGRIFLAPSIDTTLSDEELALLESLSPNCHSVLPLCQNSRLNILR